MIRKILEAIDYASGGDQLTATVAPRHFFQNMAVVRRFEAGKKIIPGLDWDLDDNVWTVTAPAYADKEAFDKIVAEARRVASREPIT